MNPRLLQNCGIAITVLGATLIGFAHQIAFYSGLDSVEGFDPGPKMVLGYGLMTVVLGALLSLYSVKKGRRQCPNCAELVKLEARTCRFCKKDL